jgi:hypothetical protein
LWDFESFEIRSSTPSSILENSLFGLNSRKN